MKKSRTIIEGKISKEPILVHEIKDEKFYDFVVSVDRKSENKDLITVTVSEKIIDINSLKLDMDICVKGNIRTYNQPINEYKKIKLTLLAKEVIILEKDSKRNYTNNLVVLNGFICKEPVYRVTQSGKRICDLMLAVNLNKHKSSYIPLLLWEDNADKFKNLSVGDNIGVIGRLQSREYVKKIEDESEVLNVAYEVSVMKVMVIKSNMK